MILSFPIIISFVLLLEASFGSAGNSNDNGKRKLGDTSFNPPQSSSASKRLQHSDSPQPQPSHHENVPQQQQARPLRQPKPFDLNFIPDKSSISSSEETISADLVGPSRGHFAAVPYEDEHEDENTGTSIPLDQVSPLPQIGLEEMPAASTAQMGFMTRNKNPIQGEREHLKRKKQDDAIHSLNVELGVATQNSSKAKWRTLEAYGQYILWLEKILLENEARIRSSLTAAKQKELHPESLQIQIQIQIIEFELYIKNAVENAEYEIYYKKMFLVDPDEISKNMNNEFEGRKDYPTIEYGKWILLLILPKLFMKKPQEINVAYAIDLAKKYAKSLREQFLNNYANELADPPNFFGNLPSTDQQAEGQYQIINDRQPNKELELAEWDSFKNDIKTEMGIPNSIKTVGIWLILDAYRRDILWLESLLLSNRQKIRDSLILSGKENLIPTFNLLLKSAETNRKYEHTSLELFKLTPEEIANDPENKRIHDVLLLETVGRKKTNAEAIKLYKVKNEMAEQALYAILPKLFMKKMPHKDIRTLAFEWARQYRKSLRDNFLAAFQDDWKPKHNFMPDILKRRNERPGTASTSSTVGKSNRKKDKQKMHEH